MKSPLGKHKGASEAVRQSFFLYFMFSLLCATLRWQWRGVLWTSVAALAIFVGLDVFGAAILVQHKARAAKLGRCRQQRACAKIAPSAMDRNKEAAAQRGACGV